MICKLCARAADVEAGMVRAGIDFDGGGHDAEVCRDFGKAIQDCGCQHLPVGSVTPGDGGARS
jgi:hypothetical protein